MGVSGTWPAIAGIGECGRVVDNRRVEYGGGRIEEITNIENNLKEWENLELLN